MIMAILSTMRLSIGIYQSNGIAGTPSSPSPVLLPPHLPNNRISSIPSHALRRPQSSRHQNFLPAKSTSAATTTTSSTVEDDGQTSDATTNRAPAPWEAATQPPGGPAVQSTLQSLEWQRLTRQVAGFAQTTLGQRSCLLHYPANSLVACEALLAETRAVDALISEFSGDVDFGGIQTVLAAEGIQRSHRGGILTGHALLAVSSLLTGAAKLQKSIASVSKDAEFTGLGDSTAVLQPILHKFKELHTLPEIVSEIGFSIREGGVVREAASEEVKKAAGKVRTVEGRLRGILKNSAVGGGEITEQGGRMCVAVQASPDGPPRGGIFLASGPGGTVWYIEPSAAVPLNNELIAVKAELTAAEDAVLWRLTALVGDVFEELQRVLCAVVWLDGVAARARYGRWISGTLPRLIPFPKTGKAHGKGAKRKKAAAALNALNGEMVSTLQSSTLTSSSARSTSVVVFNSSGETVDDDDDDDGDGGEDGSGGFGDVPTSFLVYLKKFRHPLLLGDYLLNGNSNGGGGDSGGGGGGGGAEVKREQRLPGWRPPTSKSNSGGGGYSSSSGSDSEESDIDDDDIDDESSKAAAARGGGGGAVVPIDITIAAETRAVVITGPNTGGKTATMKALGLAALAARAGLPLPAASPALIPCFDAVLADIGDEQSLTASLSTFSGHLRRIEAVRGESTSQSLILLDELGTGTDPTEGSALGIALLRVLSRGGPGGAALTVATTHHSAVTALKYENEVSAEGNNSANFNGVDEDKEDKANENGKMGKEKGTVVGASLSGVKFENASVEFDEVKLRPTYKVLWGVPGRSNALNIAQRLGLDQEVVDDARERLGVAAAAVSASIIVLEEARKRVDGDETAVASAEVKIKSIRAKTVVLRREIAQRRAEQEIEVAVAARAAVRNARLQLAQIKRELAVRAAKEAAEAEIAALSVRDAAKLKQQKKLGWVPLPGATVFVPKLNSKAKVLAVSEDGFLTLQAGLMKISAAIDEVRAN